MRVFGVLLHTRRLVSLFGDHCAKSWVVFFLGGVLSGGHEKLLGMKVLLLKVTNLIVSVWNILRQFTANSLSMKNISMWSLFLLPLQHPQLWFLLILSFRREVFWTHLSLRHSRPSQSDPFQPLNHPFPNHHHRHGPAQVFWTPAVSAIYHLQLPFPALGRLLLVHPLLLLCHSVLVLPRLPRKCWTNPLPHLPAPLTLPRKC